MSKRRLRKIREAVSRLPQQCGHGDSNDDNDNMPLPPVCYVTGLDKVYKEIDILRHLYHRNIAILFEVSLILSITYYKGRKIISITIKEQSSRYTRAYLLVLISLFLPLYRSHS
jgi:hypothetical protein